MRVALRHGEREEEDPVVVLGELTVDLARRQVFREGREIKLTPTEYSILRELVLNAGKVLTHRHLLEVIWGKEYREETHYLRVYVGQLRRKIEPDPSQPRTILTEPGVGYRLVLSDD
jgi:two-component system KDP operon response regulator KdpE